MPRTAREPMGWPWAEGSQLGRTAGRLSRVPGQDPGAPTQLRERVVQPPTVRPGKVRTSASPPLARTSPSGRRTVAMATSPHPTPALPGGAAPQSRRGLRLYSGRSLDRDCRARGTRNARGGGGWRDAKGGSHSDPGLGPSLAPEVLTLHFAERPDPQRVSQDVVADLHPPVVFLLLGCRHLSPGTESAHGAAGGGGGGGQGLAGGGRGEGGDAGGEPRSRATALRRPPRPRSQPSGADAPPGGAGGGLWEGPRYLAPCPASLRHGAPAHLRAGGGFLDCREGPQPLGSFPLAESLQAVVSPNYYSGVVGTRSPSYSKVGRWALGKLLG